MSLFEIIILALLQAATEFLPISSSAHLLLYAELFTQAPLPLVFNVALHGGSTLALLVYFRKDWLALLKQERQQPMRSNLLPLAVATLPVAIIGLFAQHHIATHLHSPAMTVVPLAIIGVLLWQVDQHCPSKHSMPSLTYRHALYIGVAQVLALIPGVSRSGITMLAARSLGYDRNASVKIAFMLATPVLLGALLLKSAAILELIAQPQYLIGVVICGVASFIVIKFLLRYIARIGFAIFAGYRLLLALTIIVYLLWKP
ncbi:MAG: undecaprenyl-diphosphate phosphatase [Pseudomonadota bacterium]|nr:undecaprenyl-diphosphate phosphatase [Pseudomonadota bacterium]